MIRKKIDVNFNWIDDEVASIKCPYCKEEITINIYEDLNDRCKCGKRFVLNQRNWIEEIIEE
jgi:DNA-directed RNA polymerase subunit RPC12/RpoP